MGYLLDTDTLSLYGNGDEIVGQRVDSTPLGQLSISVITVEEQLAGWYDRLRTANTPEHLVAVYDRLALNVELIRQFQILRFTSSAHARYEALRLQKLNVRKYDLRIAAIALENGATVVTRNVRDFERVPDLRVEDWSAAAP
jgi:tRNA(fMet)-specific endonuclease VapC